jgi:branched-chain amino acid transport system permease protein
VSASAETVQLPAASGQTSSRWRPSTQGWIARAVVSSILLGLILAWILPAKNLAADRISNAVIYAIIGLSLNIVMGYTGQVSLGHHAFVGIGAFASAYYVTEKAHCTEGSCSMPAFITGVLIAILIGALSAGLLGLVALRIKGLYLALITLTYGFVAVNSIFEIQFLTRGGAGMPAPRPEEFASDKAYMWLCILVLGFVLFVDWRLVSSKVGRAILAVKHSESVAATYAVNVTNYKVFAFMLSGAIAGLAGSLFAHRRGIVVGVDFTFQIALLWVLMVVVGGLGKRLGVVIGSMFFALFSYIVNLITPLQSFIEDTLKRNPEEFTLVMGPLLALLTLVQFQGGIAEQISPLTRWLSGEKFSMHPEGHKPKEKGGGLKALLRGKGDAASPSDRRDSPEPSEDDFSREAAEPEETVGGEDAQQEGEPAEPEETDRPQSIEAALRKEKD